MLKQITLLALTLLLVAGCESKSEEKTAAQATVPPAQLEPLLLLKEPINATLVETATEALPLWRKTAISKPTLLLMAKNSQLQSIPEEIREKALETTNNADLEEIRRTELTTSVDPVILPNMALSAALDAGFFSRVVWVLPVGPGKNVTLDSFLEQQLKLGDITREEADSFVGGENSFNGTIRNTPFTVTLMEHIPSISTPVVFHFDVGFLGESYKNEISTPLYKHTYDTLKQLSSLNLPTVAVSIAQSNITGEVSLKTRFLGPLIARLIKDPSLLEAPLSESDKLRNEALYLGNFFKKDDVLALCKKMVEIGQEDASAYFDLYQTLRQFKQSAETFSALAQAAQLDPAYAMEYLALTELAIETKQPLDALKMLKSASAFFPKNKTLDIGIAEILIATGQTDKARAILDELRQLPWSKFYHRQINERFDQMLEWANKQDAAHVKAKAEAAKQEK